MKAYTDLEQSKKLIEILPINSADMHYATWTILDGEFIVSPNQGSTIENLQEDYGYQIIPCWSLAALLGVLPKEVEIEGQHYVPCLFPVQNKWLLKLWYNSNYTITSPVAIFSDNPIDACYEMILKLHKQKLL